MLERCGIDLIREHRDIEQRGGHDVVDYARLVEMKSSYT